MRYRLSEEQEERCVRRLDGQGGYGSICADTDWGWVQGELVVKRRGVRFRPSHFVVRDPAHSGWIARQLTRAPVWYWSERLPRPVEVSRLLQVTLGWLLWLLLQPVMGLLWGAILPLAVLTAAEGIIMALRRRWLHQVDLTDDPGDHGRRLLAIADQVDHTTLWQACTDPHPELANYDHDLPADPASTDSQYDQPPYLTDADLRYEQRPHLHRRGTPRGRLHI